MTECTQSSFGFENCGGREVVASFDGGTISSDGGSLLLRQTDQQLNLLPRLASCFVDRRDPERVEHSVLEMLSQRIYGLALGYEDVNDHEDLRVDPLFAMLAGRKDLNRPLAGKSTLNRMELGNGMPDRDKKITFWKDSVDELLVAIFIESHDKAPEQVIVDVDTTALPLHGKQEGRFFHGYYDCYCYLPLFIFCGEHVSCARLRQSDSDASAGSLREMQRVIAQMRAAWPDTRIILRGDSGFCRNQLMSWCESNKVEYVFGLARNQRLRRIIGREMWQATEEWNRTGKPARIFAEFSYATKEYKEAARVGPGTPSGSQSRAHRRKRESTFRGHVTESGAMAGPELVRGTVLRQRRHGEPDQRTVQPVCRSGQCRDDASQPVASVPVCDGLCPGQRTAAPGSEGNRNGRRTS